MDPFITCVILAVAIIAMVGHYDRKMRRQAAFDRHADEALSTVHPEHDVALRDLARREGWGA